jgi:dTDP-4-dehydrorhamnose reductase
MKQSLVCTGLSGLVGSKLAQRYADEYTFTNLDISNPDYPTDITDLGQVTKALEQNDAAFAIHFAAFTNVTAAWDQRDDKSGPAYKVNVVGTENLVKACQATGKHLIHISTAFVFDGANDGLYTEEDKLSPIEWYGQTKAWAEEAVTNSEIDWTILRIDFPFRSDSFPRPDIVRKTIEMAQKGYPLFDDHYFGPTYIDDFVKVVDWVVRTKQTGLFNACSGEKWSDFTFAQAINNAHHLGLTIKPGKLDAYLQTLQRPYQRNTTMSNQKLTSMLDFELQSIEDALAQVVL